MFIYINTILYIVFFFHFEHQEKIYNLDKFSIKIYIYMFI
jgi:hypothetical protein